MCKDPVQRVTRLLAAILVVALCILVALVSGVRAHSWYDPDCCSGNDCQPVQSISFVASDPASLPVMIVTTSIGTQPVTKETKIRQSKDNQMHACIWYGKLLCLYLPPGQ